MESYLKGRVRNCGIKPRHCLVPLFEAITNGLQAIDDRRAEASSGENMGEVRVSIERDQRQRSFRSVVPPVSGLAIADDGIGFDDRHLAAFRRLDDDFRIRQGGKGVGRISWLTAFENVEIESCYKIDNKSSFVRRFRYAIADDGVANIVTEPADASRLTGSIVRLTWMNHDFRMAWPKQPETLLNRLAVHFQRVLALPEGPEITIIDPCRPQEVKLREYFRDQFQIERHEEQLSIDDVRFDVVHLLHRVSGERSEQYHHIALLANDRAVETRRIPAGLGIPKGAIRADGSALYYTGFVSGQLLDDAANDARTHLDLRGEAEPLFEGEVAREQIIELVAAAGRSFLGHRLNALEQELWKRINAICEREIRYRPLLSHCKQELRRIEPTLTDSRLEDAIHAIYRDYMNKLRERTRAISKRAARHIDDLGAFRRDLSEVLTGWNEAAMADLAAYVADRRAVLWFLQHRLEMTPAGKYGFEQAVHAVFFPMGFDSDNYPVEAANLWLIDERMAFHEYLASDMAIRSHRTLKSDAKGEPDVAVYHATHAFGGNEQPRAAVTLVEFKRPGRDDYTTDDNPYVQVMDYIDDIRDGSAILRDGRPVSDADQLRFFCYVVCDTTKSLRRALTKFDFLRTTDGRGFFKYVSAVNAYIEVVPYDKLVDDAVLRNRVLFNKLNLPESAGGGFAEEDAQAAQGGDEQQEISAAANRDVTGDRHAHG